MACPPCSGGGQHSGQSGWNVEALTCRDSTSEVDEGSENFSDERGLERMNHNYDARLWAVLEKGKLADLSQFHQDGFFDEVPLYSRKSDVDFLPDGERGDEISLVFALKFLNSVIAYQPHRRAYFAAITVWDFSDDHIVPNLFAWCRPIRELDEKMSLRKITTAFGKRIRKFVSKSRPLDQFSLLEDVETDRDTTRVFIAPVVSPYGGFVTLDHFMSRAMGHR
jgi:hypothetical protein